MIIKVIINPRVPSLPCSPSDADTKMQDTSGLYPVCVVTCAMTKNQLTSRPNSHNKEPKSDILSQSSGSSTSEGPPDLAEVLKPTWMDR